MHTDVSTSRLAMPPNIPTRNATKNPDKNRSAIFTIGFSLLIFRARVLLRPYHFVEYVAEGDDLQATSVNVVYNVLKEISHVRYVIE